LNTQQENLNRTAADTPALNSGGSNSTRPNCGPGTEGPWIVGDKCTIADLACFGWVNWAELAGVELDPFPKVKKWLDTINEPPAVKRGLDVPEKF
jgi:glutathione S-transferase